MHPYATDSHERITIPLILGAGALLAALGLGRIIQKLQLQNLWWLDLPAVWGFYGLFVTLFDRWIWRWGFLRTIGLVRVPDLNGKWRGIGVSSYAEEEGQQRTTYEVEIDIRQNWTRLCVFLETQTSRSQSRIGALMLSDGKGPMLSYEHHNEPKPHAAGTMHPHRGMTRLELVAPTVLDGEYYTGRDRRNYGSLRVDKVV